jgi:hypothetical protein
LTGILSRVLMATIVYQPRQDAARDRRHTPTRYQVIYSRTKA